MTHAYHQSGSRAAWSWQRPQTGVMIGHSSFCGPLGVLLALILVPVHVLFPGTVVRFLASPPVHSLTMFVCGLVVVWGCVLYVLLWNQLLQNVHHRISWLLYQSDRSPHRADRWPHSDRSPHRSDRWPHRVSRSPHRQKYMVARSVSDHPVWSPIGVVRSVIYLCCHRSRLCGQWSPCAVTESLMHCIHTFIDLFM